MGEWVDLDSPPRPLAPDEQPEVSSGGWLGSSFDLLRGTEVSDDPDTVPDALLDELFSTRRTLPAKTPKEKP